MTAYESALIACAVSTMALVAYPNQAASLGWRTGALFALPATKVTLVGGLIAVALFIQVLANVVSGVLPWWWILLIPLSALLGGALLTGVIGRSTGLFALIASPASYIAANYFFYAS